MNKNEYVRNESDTDESPIGMLIFCVGFAISMYGIALLFSIMGG